MPGIMMAALGLLLVAVLGIALDIQRTHDFDDLSIDFNGYSYGVPSAEALGGGVRGTARQTQTVITGLVIVITASLAVIVVDEFDQSLGTPQSSQLSTAQNDVLSGFGDMVSLIGPLLLVLIATVIVGVVQRLRA